jgi:hypothetical protein
MISLTKQTQPASGNQPLQLQKERSPSANTAIQYYNAVPATQRWHDLAFTLARAAPPQSPNRQARLAAILHNGHPVGAEHPLKANP